MGTWGPGIFSNDVAADARSEWRDALVGGEDPAAASTRIIRAFGGGLGDAEFWTGLAAAQHETGHLQDDVRDRALEVVSAGADLDHWEGADRSARARALERLAAKLRGPQPPPKKLRGPRAGPDPGVQVGDVLRVWSRDRERWALFCVVAFEEQRRRRWPVVLGLFTDDEQRDVPPAGELAALPYLSAVDVSAIEADAELPDWHLVDAPLLWTCMVARRGEEFDAHIGEIVARGIRPDCLRGSLDPAAAHEGPLTDVSTSFEALVELVGSTELDLCREATRRRLDGRGAVARREFERGNAMVQRLWADALRRQLGEASGEDIEDLSPRDAALLEELQAAGAEILAEMEQDADDD
jgi:hypothetical protein